MAQADSRTTRAKAFCHAQSGPSNAPQKRVYRLRKRTREVSAVGPAHSFQNFMRGRSLSLTGDLPGVGPHTIQSISRMAPSLTELRLNGFSKISDETFSSIIASLPLLELLDVSYVGIVNFARGY